MNYEAKYKNKVGIIDGKYVYYGNYVDKNTFETLRMLDELSYLGVINHNNYLYQVQKLIDGEHLKLY